MPDLVMHINYFETGHDIATAFEKAARYGFDGIELRGSVPELERDAYLSIVEREWKRTGLKSVIFANPCDLTMADAAQRQANVENAIGLLRRTAAMGVTCYNTMAGAILAPGTSYREFHKNGSAAASEAQWEWAAEGYRKIGAVAEELGVKLAFETHNCYIHDLAKATSRLLKMIGSPAIGVNLDMGNIVLNANGETLDEAISILGNRIYYTHLKNVYLPTGGGFLVCPLSDGVIDNRRLLRLLKEIGYAGPLGLEAPRQGDRDHFARQDIAYVRELLRDLEWE